MCVSVLYMSVSVCVCVAARRPRVGQRDSREFGCSHGSDVLSSAIWRSRRLKCDSASVVVSSSADSATDFIERRQIGPLKLQRGTQRRQPPPPPQPFATPPAAGLADRWATKYGHQRPGPQLPPTSLV